MLFDRLELVQTYVDDPLVLTKGSFDDHLEKLKWVLHRLQKAGLKVKGNESFFTRTELEHLGHWNKG